MRVRPPALSTVLMTVGALLVADAVVSVVWQEPLTSLTTAATQRHLHAQWAALERAKPTALELRTLATLRSRSERIAFLARSLQARTPAGGPVGRLRIPRLGVDFVIVKGTAAPDLRRGPGFYDGLAFPGVPGTAAIAGHRTMYEAPFRHIDRLHPGDAIDVQMPYARFTYRVVSHEVVSPDDIGVVRRVRYDRLILSACHPLFSAAKRWVVSARLADVVPTYRFGGLPPGLQQPSMASQQLRPGVR
jgi:sortase A